MRSIEVTAFLASLSVLALTGCTHEDRAQPAVPSTNAVPVTSGSLRMDDELDDPRIATVAESLRDGLEERARVALDHTSDPGLRAFAARILADDPGVSITLMNLAPSSSILEDEVTSDTYGDTGALSVRSGPSFDRDFLDSERRALESASRLLEARLIPAAESARLRMDLTQMSAAIASELREADRLAAAATAPLR
jgi:predicted outer membrane protein